MSLEDEVYRLTGSQVKDLCSTLLEASLALELGYQDWQEILRRAKHRKVGRQRRILEALLKLNEKEFDNVSKELAQCAR